MDKVTITIDILKSAKPRSVLASGIIPNSPDGLYMTEQHLGRDLIWVAHRGGYHDWAIYVHWADLGIDHAIRHGDKVIMKENIKKLVNCDDDAMKMYRL